jgi:hypothetical protein
MFKYPIGQLSTQLSLNVSPDWQTQTPFTAIWLFWQFLRQKDPNKKYPDWQLKQYVVSWLMHVKHGFWQKMQ